MLFPAPVISVTFSVSFAVGWLGARLSQRRARQAERGGAGDKGPKEFTSLWVHHGQYCIADRYLHGRQTARHPFGRVKND